MLAPTSAQLLLKRVVDDEGSVVVACLAGGLGNQLFQYAAGRVAAMRKKARLRMDVSFYHGNKERQYTLSHFTIDEEDLLSHAESRVLRYWLGPRHRLLKAVAKVVLPSLCINRVDDPMSRVVPDALTAAGHLYLTGYWQSPIYFDGEEDLIRREFRLREAPDAQIARRIEQMKSCDSVAVHVRRGDYVSNRTFHSVHGICTMDYYERAAQIVRDSIRTPTFFVFSDDLAAAKRELRLPGRTEFVTENLGKRDWEDLRLMSSCRHHIIANSSFSWWGAWLAKHDRQIVVAPKMWFQPRIMADHRIEDRIPPTWLTI